MKSPDFCTTRTFYGKEQSYGVIDCLVDYMAQVIPAIYIQAWGPAATGQYQPQAYESIFNVLIQGGADIEAKQKIKYKGHALTFNGTLDKVCGNIEDGNSDQLAIMDVLISVGANWKPILMRDPCRNVKQAIHNHPRVRRELLGKIAGREELPTAQQKMRM